MSTYPHVPGIAGAVPHINPETLLGRISTLGDLSNAILTYGAWRVRTITPADLAAERAASGARVLEVFGSSGEDDLARFFKTHSHLVRRAELVNLASHPAFALAAVRAMRAAG